MFPGGENTVQRIAPTVFLLVNRLEVLQIIAEHIEYYPTLEQQYEAQQKCS